MSDIHQPTGPPRPSHAGNLEFLRKRAKSLLRACHDGDPDAVSRVSAAVPQSRDPAARRFTLAEAQHAIARELGFASWPELRHRFERTPMLHGVPSLNPHLTKESNMSTQSASTTSLGLSAIDQIGLSCTDLDEARRFYCSTLGLRDAGEIPGMASFFDCAGVNIIMFKADKPAPASVLYFNVPGTPGLIQQKVAQLKSAGVKVEQDPQCIAQNWHGHDVYLAFFRDPFGNMLALKSNVPVKA